MKKDNKIYLGHILECVKAIESYTKNVSKEEFQKHLEKQDAIIRRLEIIGEAVKNLSPELKKKNPDIPWQDIAGMRDVLIHHYFCLNFDLVWKTSKEILPEFKKQIIKLISKE